MNELCINFAHHSDSNLYDQALRIHLALTTSPVADYFLNYRPTPADLKVAMDLFAEALSKETSKSVTALRKSRREDLVNILREIAAALEIEAKGDQMRLAATGYALKKKAHRSSAPTETPQNVRARTTTVSGELLAKCNPVDKARSYELQHSTTANGPWIAVEHATSSQKMIVTGLERGKDIYIRIRAFGPNGYSGWSDIATIMVV